MLMMLTVLIAGGSLQRPSESQRDFISTVKLVRRGNQTLLIHPQSSGSVGWERALPTSTVPYRISLDLSTSQVITVYSPQNYESCPTCRETRLIYRRKDGFLLLSGSFKSVHSNENTILIDNISNPGVWDEVIEDNKLNFQIISLKNGKLLVDSLQFSSRPGCGVSRSASGNSTDDIVFTDSTLIYNRLDNCGKFYYKWNWSKTPVTMTVVNGSMR